MTAHDNSPPPPTVAWRKWLLPLLLMGGLTVVLYFVRGEPLRDLDRPRLDDAVALWEASKPGSYRISIQLEGRQRGRFDIQVRDGEVIDAQLDGRPLPQRRTRETWSVDGMFQTLRTDLEMRERAQQGQPGARSLRLKAVLHKQYGLPMRYLRIEVMRKGANPEAGWSVLSFEPANAEAAP